MSQTDDLDAILQRIEDGQQAEENFAALCEILRGGRRREVLQKLAKYNLQIQEVAGGDLQIGDRIYNGWTEQAFDTLLQAVRSQISELLQAQPSKTNLEANFKPPLVDGSPAVSSDSSSAEPPTNSKELSYASTESGLTYEIKQEMATDLEVAGDIEAGDMAQKAKDAAAIEQVMVKNVVAENIKLGNLTQEG